MHPMNPILPPVRSSLLPPGPRRFRRAFRLALGAGALLGGLAPTARAGLFVVDVVPSMTPPFTVGGTDFVQLVEDMLTAGYDFSTLLTQSYQAQLTYLGVPHALQAYSNGGGTQVSFQSGLTGLNVSFHGATRFEVEDQVERWFEKEGLEEWSKILAAIARHSPVAITDGNPQSATARTAHGQFANFGFSQYGEAADLAAFEAGGDGDGESGGGVGLGLMVSSGQFEVDLPNGAKLEGSSTQLEIPFSYRFNEKTALRASIPLEWTDLDGPMVYGAGLNVGVPYQAYAISAERNWAWKITPAAGVFARVSPDTASGAALWNVGVTSVLDWKVGPDLILSLANQIGFLESFKVSYDDYEFDSGVSQQILINGVRARWRFAPRWIAEALLIDTRFLEDVFLDGYQTLGAGLRYRIGRKTSVGLNGKLEWGDDYEAWNIGLSSAWKF